MADITVDSEDNGAYEVPIGGDEHTKFHFPGVGLNQPILLTFHSGGSPLYYTTRGDEFDPKDPRQLMLPPGNDVLVRLSSDFGEAVITVVSASDGIVSVSK